MTTVQAGSGRLNEEQRTQRTRRRIADGGPLVSAGPLGPTAVSGACACAQYSLDQADDDASSSCTFSCVDGNPSMVGRWLPKNV